MKKLTVTNPSIGCTPEHPGRVIAALASLCVSYPVLFKQLGMRASEFVASVWRPLVASALMGLSVHAITLYSAGDGSLSIAIKRAHGSLKGSAIAAQLEKFKGVAVLGGKIGFSRNLHTVFGRTYRVIKIQNNKATLAGTVTAKVVPKL